MPSDSARLLMDGRRALEGGDVPTAMAAFEAALELEDSPSVRNALAGLRYVDDALDEARLQWEAAFDLYRRSDDPRGAARVAASLADLHAAGFGNFSAARGWVSRGGRLLQPEGRCLELGYLELAMVACIRDDMAAVERSADAALSVALEFHDSALELRALADGGLALVTQGREREGLARHDEALALMSSGQIHDVAVLGKSLCALLSACDRTGDLQRAEECTRLVEELLERRLSGRPRMLTTHCRTVYGSVLCVMGNWSEGERVLTEALGPRSSTSLYHRMLTCCHLADLRVMQGRLVEAATLLGPWAGRPDAFAPLARLHLAAGDLDLAASLAAAGLAALHAEVLRAAPLWSVLVSVELTRGDLPAATAAADALRQAAEHTALAPIRAEALLAAGRVTLDLGDAAAAAVRLGEARAALGDEHRPMLRGVIGRALAEALACQGHRDLAIAEGQAALAVFRSLGALPDADRTAALLRRLGAPAHPIRMHATDPASVLTPREREVLQLLEEGLTNSEIARRLYVSTKTVEHHVSRILSKLGVHTRAQAVGLNRLPSAEAPDTLGWH